MYITLLELSLCENSAIPAEEGGTTLEEMALLVGAAENRKHGKFYVNSLTLLPEIVIGDFQVIWSRKITWSCLDSGSQSLILSCCIGETETFLNMSVILHS